MLSAHLNVQEMVYPWAVPPPGVRSVFLIDPELTLLVKKKKEKEKERDETV